MEQHDSITRRQRILDGIAAARGPLSAPGVTLVAVAKTHPAEALRPLLAAGHRVFGENKVQEAAAKWPALRADYPDMELHLIGSLQSNKAREALDLFDVIETLDRPSLVEALAKERARAPGLCRAFYLQINTGEEPQKGGALPQDLPALRALCAQKQLPISGLMCVPPAQRDPAPHFAFLHKLARENGLAALSMGMSHDYEQAVRFGATHIRIGTALFGQRQGAG